MKVRNEVIEKLRANKEAKLRLLFELNISGATLERWYMKNKPNGNMTKDIVKQILSEELNIPIEEILINETLKSE